MALPGLSTLFGTDRDDPPVAIEPIKRRLNDLIRAHNTHVEESKQLRTSLSTFEDFAKAQHEQLDESLRTFMHQQFEEMDQLKQRVFRLEELVRTLATELLSVAHRVVPPTQ